MHLTFKQLQVIYAVTKHKQLTAAAHAMHLTQPGISAHMKQIELQLGYPLFKRSQKQWILTRAGQAAWPHIAKLFACYDHVSQSLSPQQVIAGDLAVAVPSGVASAILPFLHYFQQQHPQVKLSIDVSDRISHYQKLEDEQIDLAFMGKPQGHEELLSQRIFSYKTVVIAAKNYAQLQSIAKRPGPKKIPQTQTCYTCHDLQKLCWLMPPAQTNSHYIFKSYFYNKKTPIIAINQMQLVIEMVALGMGLSVVPEPCLKPQHMKQIQILKVDNFPITNETYLVHQQRIRLTPTIRTFITMAQQYWNHKPTHSAEP